MSFTREQLESFHGKGLPDLVGPGMRLLLVGINPGLWSAAAGAPFARRGNRFYPALHQAGIVDQHEMRRPVVGYRPEGIRQLLGIRDEPRHLRTVAQGRAPQRHGGDDDIGSVAGHDRSQRHQRR